VTPAGFEGALRAAGLSPSAVEAQRAALGRVLDVLPAGDGPVGCAFVPGRIEVVGKHTDYAGGRSLVCAVEHGFAVAWRPRRDARLRVVDALAGEAVEGDAGTADGLASRPWGTYVAAATRRASANFGATRGADVAFHSDLPPAAGLSSSSALLIAVFLALHDVNDLGRHPAFRVHCPTLEALAAYLATVENGSGFGTLAGDSGVGTRGGSQDHTAILGARAGHVTQFAYRPTRRERDIACPAGLRFAVAASGVAAEKTGAALDAYNRAAGATAVLLERWNAATGRADDTLAAACDADAGAPATLRRVAGRPGPDGWDPNRLIARLDQFLLETRDLVPAAGDALASGQAARLGLVTDRSQRAAEDWLDNQVPETIALQHLARAEGAHAASAFGAGFGGAVWALVDAGEAPAFLERWRERYTSTHPGPAARAVFLLTRPGPGAVWDAG
jgi:galactokinase